MHQFSVFDFLSLCLPKAANRQSSNFNYLSNLAPLSSSYHCSFFVLRAQQCSSVTQTDETQKVEVERKKHNKGRSKEQKICVVKDWTPRSKSPCSATVVLWPPR